MNAPQDDWVPIGFARRAHGVRGELRVELDGPDALEVLAPGTELRFSFRDGRERILEVGSKIRPIHGAVLLTLEEVTEREEVNLLKGARLYVRAELVPASEEPYFYELVGARIVDGDGRCYGTLRTVGDNGAQELLVIDGEDGRELLLPWTDDTVEAFDRDRGELLIHPIPGLWD